MYTNNGDGKQRGSTRGMSPERGGVPVSGRGLMRPGRSMRRGRRSRRK